MNEFEAVAQEAWDRTQPRDQNADTDTGLMIIATSTAPTFYMPMIWAEFTPTPPAPERLSWWRRLAHSVRHLL